MSAPCVIVGYIEEPWSTTTHTFHVWNDNVLAGLPETDDQYPPLIRSMMTAPRADQRLASFRGSRAISVALRQNYLAEDMDAWLDKFEAILRRLCWTRVCLFLDGDMWGNYEIEYLADVATRTRYGDLEASPPLSWELRCRRREVCAPPGRFLAKRPGYTTRAYSLDRVSDRMRVQSMLEAAQVAQQITSGRLRSELDNDLVFFHALTGAARDIAFHGSWVSDEAMTAHSWIPWAYIPAYCPASPDCLGRPGSELRKLVLDKLWSGCQEHLDELIAGLKNALACWPE